MVIGIQKDIKELIYFWFGTSLLNTTILLLVMFVMSCNTITTVALGVLYNLNMLSIYFVIKDIEDTKSVKECDETVDLKICNNLVP